MVTYGYAAKLIEELQAEREPLVEKFVLAQEEERELQERLQRLVAANQSVRSRLTVIDQALQALRPLAPPSSMLEPDESSNIEAKQETSAVRTTEADLPDRNDLKPSDNPSRRAVIDVVTSMGRPMLVEQSWKELERRQLPHSPNRKAFGLMLMRMYNAGFLSRPEYGIYGLPLSVSSDLRPGLRLMEPDHRLGDLLEETGDPS